MAKPKYAHTQRPVLLALGEPETLINTVLLSSVAIPTFHRLDMKNQFMSVMKRSTELLLLSLGLSSQYRAGGLMALQREVGSSNPVPH